MNSSPVEQQFTAPSPQNIIGGAAKKRRMISTILGWLKTYESVAIWLEGIALVLIFIWDRLDSRSQHKETLKQLSIAQAQAEATRASAEAATRSANSLIGIERAWLVRQGFIEPAELPSVRVHPEQKIEFTARIRNCGRTPALLSEWLCKVLVADTMDIQSLLDYGSPHSHPGGMLFAPDEAENFFADLNTQPSALDDIQAGRKHLYVYGVVRYRDIFGGPTHETYFCFHYSRTRNARGDFEKGWALEPPEGNHLT